MSTAVFVVAVLVPWGWACLLFPKRALIRWSLAVLSCYGLLMGAVQLERQTRQRDLDAFDLNRNGLVDGNELTREARIAVEKATRDTGLVFAPVSAIGAALLWTTAAFWLRRQRTAQVA